MTSLISSLIFVISANIDNILLGFALGMKRINISFLKNIFISLLMSFITAIFMLFARIFNIFFNTKILALIASSILIFIGFYDIFNFSVSKKDTIDIKNYSKLLNLKELLYITILLSSNNISVGIIAGIAGINILYTIIFTFIISFTFLFIGNTIGKKLLNKFLLKYSQIISSILLILLGLTQILSNLY